MIYTKTGDKGETSLANGQRVKKTDTRIEAYGTVDELNSWIGLVRSAECQVGDTELICQADEQLLWIQNKLFNLGALLSEAEGEWIKEEDVISLESWIDQMQETLPKRFVFILPAGSEMVCRCHVARTVCRRAERRMIDAEGDQTAIKFINRLSDYLFVLSRYVANSQKEVEEEWKKA